MQPDNHQSTHRNLQAPWTDGGMRVGSTSGSLPPVPPNVRSVRGSDVLVYEHCGLVTCAIIQECLWEKNDGESNQLENSPVMGIVKLITGLNKRDTKDSPLPTVIEQLPHGWK